MAKPLGSGTRDGLTEDAILGGRVRLLQPQRGHRVGHDAVLLAAATRAKAGDHVVELGAGVGAAGLALAERIPGVKVTLVEIDPVLIGIAAENSCLNRLDARVTAVALDVAAPARAFAAAGLKPGCADAVMMNPPFNDAARTPSSPERGRALAHAAPRDTLTVWVKAALRLLGPKGRLTLIWRADGLADVLGAVSGSFGDVRVLPVHPKPEAAAIRVLVRAVRGSRAPLAVMPGLLLADGGGRPTEAAEAILRRGGTLPLGES